MSLKTMYRPSSIRTASISFAVVANQHISKNSLAKKVRVLISTFSLILMSSVLTSNIVSAQSQATINESNENETAASTISNDFRLPVTLNSKNQSLDGKKKTSIFIDNVVIRQGSLEILADRVEADATAGKGKEIITAIGKPASYKQRLEDGSYVIASANEIQYTVELQTISLKGQASIKQNDIKVNGDSIAFDMAKEQIMASTDANSSESVTTVLSPGSFSSKKNADEDKQ